MDLGLVLLKGGNMRHSILCTIMWLTCSIVVFGQEARIKIDIDRQIGQIDRFIYGNFVEHLGRCVYGGIFDPCSPLADKDGLRRDVLEAVRDLNVTIIRYPGGNFVSNYHWLDGVGPERIPRLELAWSRLETNRFGTNEFIKFVRAVGAEPYFAVNMGTGTIEESQRWVEYCNIKDGPYYAELRKAHGFPEPHRVLFWSLGNEMDGPWQMGHMTAEDYCKKAREAAKLMRLTCPEIKIIAAGSSNYRPGADQDHWNSTILHELRDVIDYIALHIYVGNPDDNYYNFLATPRVMEQRTRVVKGMIDREMVHANRADRGPIYIAWDEYNVWYRARTGAARRGERALEERYNLEDALVIAGFLNGFVRNADCIKMANMAQLVNVIAPIFTNEQGLFRQTIYFPLQLFSKYVHGQALDVYVDGPTYDTERFSIGLGETTTIQKQVPYLDVCAAYDRPQVVICVLNRHKDRPLTLAVNGPDIKAQNDFGKEIVKTDTRPRIDASGTEFSYTFPAHSFTLLKGRIRTGS
jgi:alpha-N-arabinofuranosidase